MMLTLDKRVEDTMVEEDAKRFEAEDEISEVEAWGDSPYQVTDVEFAPVYAKYEKFVFFCAHQVARKMGYKNNHDVVADIAQEIFLAMARCCQKYKRQAYIIGCYKFFKANPRLIPCRHFSRVMCAMMYWQLRATLGPKHGFSVNHDRFLAEAADAVKDVAPDFRYEAKEIVIDYISSNKDEIEAAVGQNVLAKYLDALENNMTTSREEYGAKINEKAELFSPYGTKPSRFAPLVVDHKFGPLIKKYIVNHGNKTFKRRSKIDMVGHVPLEDFADVIPDTRMSSGNAFYSPSQDYKRRPVIQDEDMSFYRDSVQKDAQIASGYCFERSTVFDLASINDLLKKARDRFVELHA